jgi:hypothetical protein
METHLVRHKLLSHRPRIQKMAWGVIVHEAGMQSDLGQCAAVRVIPSLLLREVRASCAPHRALYCKLLSDARLSVHRYLPRPPRPALYAPAEIAITPLSSDELVAIACLGNAISENVFDWIERDFLKESLPQLLDKLKSELLEHLWQCSRSVDRGLRQRCISPERASLDRIAR